MAYQGSKPGKNYQSIPAVQRFDGDGSDTTFTLNRTVSSVQDVLVSVDGVMQDTTAYTIPDGTTLTFTEAPSDGTANIFVNYLGVTDGTITPPKQTLCMPPNKDLSVLVDEHRNNPNIEPAENSLISCIFRCFLKTYDLVTLLASCMIPCNAITINPWGIIIAIIANNIIPPPIPSIAEIDDVINAAIIRIIYLLLTQMV